MTVVNKGAKRFAQIAREIRVFETHDIVIGFIEGEKQTRSGSGKNQTAAGRQEINNATLAAIHEFGTSDGTIPPRLGMREFADARQEQIGMQIDKAFDKIVKGKKAMTQLERLGTWAVAQHKLYVRDVQPGPPLTPETIRRKKSTKKMIDTGQLLNAETFLVRRSTG